MNCSESEEPAMDLAGMTTYFGRAVKTSDRTYDKEC